MPANAIEILLLGTFEVRIAGRCLQDSDIPGRKAPALFKLIALAHDQQLLRDRAMDALWSELDQTKASAQLYKAIHQLGKTLAASGSDGADQWLTTSRDSIGLSAPVGEAFAAIVGCGVAGARGDTEHYRQARERAISLVEKAVSRGSGSPRIWLFDRLAASA